MILNSNYSPMPSRHGYNPHLLPKKNVNLWSAGGGGGRDFSTARWRAPTNSGAVHNARAAQKNIFSQQRQWLTPPPPLLFNSRLERCVLRRGQDTNRGNIPIHLPFLPPSHPPSGRDGSDSGFGIDFGIGKKEHIENMPNAEQNKHRPTS